MQKYVDFGKTYSTGHYNQYRDDSFVACVYNKEVASLYEFLDNNFTKYGKFIMLEHHKFKKGNNIYHHVFNIETKTDGCLPANVIKNTAFSPSTFIWRFSQLNNMWRSMIKRCYNPRFDKYEMYGARGIAMSREWYNPSEDTNYGNWNEKENFRDWCIYNGFANNQDLEIDRYNSNGNFSPENCQLVSHEYNALFKSRANIIHISFNGIIDIFDTEAAWSRFITNNDSSSKPILSVCSNVKSKYPEFANMSYNYCKSNMPDNIRLDESVYYILQNLPIDFIDYCDVVFSQIGVCPVIPVYWDRRKPWFSEW